MTDLFGRLATGQVSSVTLASRGGGGVCAREDGGGSKNGKAEHGDGYNRDAGKHC